MPGTTAFPVALDEFPEIGANTPENAAGMEHDLVHQDVHAALLALQEKVGIDDSADAGSMDARALTVPIGFGVGPAPSGITTGLKRIVRLPVAYRFTGWSLAGDAVGSAVIELWASVAYPPTVSDKITGSAPPTLASTSSAAGGVAGWTADTLPAARWLAFVVASVSGLQRLDLTLTARKVS